LTEKYINISLKEIEKLDPDEKNQLLDNLRDKVDKTDAEIAELLIERIKLSVQIGVIKKSLGVYTYDARRENEIEENLNKLSEKTDIKKSLKRIYERIIDESRAIQRERKR
jgi:chorismate mutase